MPVGHTGGMRSHSAEHESASTGTHESQSSAQPASIATTQPGTSQ